VEAWYARLRPEIREDVRSGRSQAYQVLSAQATQVGNSPVARIRSAGYDGQISEEAVVVTEHEVVFLHGSGGAESDTALAAAVDRAAQAVGEVSP